MLLCQDVRTVLGRTKGYVQVRGTYLFRNSASLYGEQLLAPFPTPKAGTPTIVSCPRLLIQYIRSYPPCLSPFLHAQIEDATCRGRIILRWIFRKWDVGAWTGIIWLKIGMGGGLL